jgi:hypothetical protein
VGGSRMGGVGHVTDPGGCPVCYRPTMTRLPRPGSRRRILAVALAAVAIGIVVVEPFPKGVVLLSLTDTHGIHAGDLPALALLLVAAWFAI